MADHNDSLKTVGEELLVEFGDTGSCSSSSSSRDDNCGKELEEPNPASYTSFFNRFITGLNDGMRGEESRSSLRERKNSGSTVISSTFSFRSDSRLRLGSKSKESGSESQSPACSFKGFCIEARIISRPPILPQNQPENLDITAFNEEQQKKQVPLPDISYGLENKSASVDTDYDISKLSQSTHSTSSTYSAQFRPSLKENCNIPLDAPEKRKMVGFNEVLDIKFPVEDKCSKSEVLQKKKRVVVMSRESQAYAKKIIPKSDIVKIIIVNTIKSNILFNDWTAEEILEFVDTFVEFNVEPGETIFHEGSEGKYFYVIETGSVSVRRQANLTQSISGCGMSFGEAALLYDVPRNETVIAQQKCKLWAISRQDYRGISCLNNKVKAEYKINFLKKVKIGNHILGEVLELSNIYNIALVMQTVSFDRDDVIANEGDKGDIFYIIESGNVDVYIDACGVDPLITMGEGQFFGEKALVYEEGVRTATCIASSDTVECFTLKRDDFSKMLGDVTWMFTTINCIEKDLCTKIKSKQQTPLIDEVNKKGSVNISLQISDFDVIRTIGVGTFGRVISVKKKVPEQEKAPYYVLKCQNIMYSKENNLMGHLNSEKKIMEELNHPFIVQFYGEFNDTQYSYFLLELLPGGEVFRLLEENGRFPESWGQFYSGTVLLAFAEIHSHNIVYRDLKPENLVLDNTGYPKLIDFGLAKKLEGGKTWTLCGTPDYMPPEVITNEGHDSAVDYWGLGVLLFEFTNGTPPFASEYPMDVYKNILSGKLEMPESFSDDLVDLIVKLLNPRQATRIGRTYGGTKEIMDHNWYSKLDFDELLQKRINAPFEPVLNNEGDMSYFEDYSEYDIGQDICGKEAETTLDYSQQPHDESPVDEEKTVEEKKARVSARNSARKITLGRQQNPYAKLFDIGRNLTKTSRDKKLIDAFDTSESKKNPDSLLIIQLMNLALSEDICEHEKSRNPFQEFTMLSVEPETLHDLALEESNTINKDSFLSKQVTFNGTRYVDPMYFKSLDVIEQFPRGTTTDKASASSLAPEALAAFCFPSGASIRLLPRCAVEGAKRLHWLGKDSDKYQLHAFTNGFGDRRYGVSITIQEEIFCGDDKALHEVLSYLRICRKKRRAARIITEWWFKYSEIQKAASEKARLNFLRTRSDPSSLNLIDKINSFRKDNSLTRRSKSTSNAFEKFSLEEEEIENFTTIPTKQISLHAKRLAAEAYKVMNDDDRGGDVCIIETCYVMVGTKLHEQSLVLSALQKLVDVEREDNAVRRMFSSRVDLPVISDHRISILKTMQSKLCLSPAQKKISGSSFGDSHTFDVDLSLGSASKISLPLPLPHISTQWGFATLVTAIQIPNLLLVLKLLLMERSVLFIGTSAEVVTASVCAISELLHPYKWVSAFMPLLPVAMLDIVDSPVPFIAGIAVQNEACLDKLERDSRIENAMKGGLSVINLSSNTCSITNDPSITPFINKFYDPVSSELLYYQSELKGFVKSKKSALNSFRTFFECGASYEEIKVLESMREIISKHLSSFSGSMSAIEGFKKFGVFDQDTHEFDFFPHKFLEPLRAQLAFQEKMTCTQMFLSFIEEKKSRLDLLEGQSANFIAGWLCTRWRCYQRKENKARSSMDFLS